MDTDSIVKMGRYGLLNAFEALAIAQGHPRPFRRLFEIKRKIDSARSDPAKSLFGTKIALEMSWSFATDCVEIPRAESNPVLEALLDIDGIDPGEALLLEYAVRNPNALIVSGDKRMIRALCGPDGAQFHAQVLGRVVHVDRVVQMLGAQPDKWTAVRAAIIAAPACDVAIYDAVAPQYADSIAQQRLLALATDWEAASNGLLRAAL